MDNNSIENALYVIELEKTRAVLRTIFSVKYVKYIFYSPIIIEPLGIKQRIRRAI